MQEKTEFETLKRLAQTVLDETVGLDLPLSLNLALDELEFFLEKTPVRNLHK